MPHLSVWIVRAALLHLGIGFTLGALMLWNKGIPFDSGLWNLLPLHIETLLIGWVVQLAMGVAYWILPRWNSERRREEFVVAASVLLNIGVLTAGSAYWFDLSSVLLIAGRVMEALAAVSFFIHAWPRVKPLAAP